MTLPLPTDLLPTTPSNSPSHSAIHNTLAEIANTGGYNVMSFGAVGDNVADDTAAFQAAFDAVHADGGGSVWIPGGRTYKITSTLSYDTIADRKALVVFAWGAEIQYNGTGYMCDFQRKNPAGAQQVGPQIFGGRWQGTAAATACFLVSDIGATSFYVVSVRDFTAGYAWELRNHNNWTELTRLIDCAAANCIGAINFIPASLDGSPGPGATESFARTTVHNMRIGGTGAGPWFNCRGSVYASEFHLIKGNVSDSPIIFHCEGGMSGTTFFHTDLEQSAYTLFEWGASFTGGALTLIGPFILRSSAVFEIGTSPQFHGYNLPLTNEGGYSNRFSGSGITLRTAGGQKVRLTLNSGGTALVFTAVT